MHAAQSPSDERREPANRRATQDIYFTVRDGMRLYARYYPAALDTGARPLVCLPGLTRNSRDFHDLAIVLSTDIPASREVFALDFRGRGRSEYDTAWTNYSPFIEALDVLDFLTLCGLHDVAMLGTSRGGIVAMIIALMRPTALGPVILNDIGPVIEATGLIRIIGYLGRLPVPMSWDEAARVAKELGGRDFPRIDDDTWAEIARQWFTDAGGVPGRAYDPQISKTFSLGDVAKGLPDMWQQFDALARKPLLVLRGENSDILSETTLRRMADRHPQMQTVIVPGQGHAPFLKDYMSIDAIATFLAGADRNRSAKTGGRAASGTRV